MQICQGIIALILLADLILIVSVRRLREEEGPPGIASVVWATLICIFCVVSDRIVAWGKAEEEERLTGRAETRRTLKEWLAILTATIILIVFILITVLFTATLTLRAVDAGLEFKGHRIEVDGQRYAVHLACVGNETDAYGKKVPTVLLESAETPSEYEFLWWLEGARENGTIERYCYWDRPGYAWSDNAPSPHSAAMSAENLAEALAIAGETGPWLLVSGGYGSLVSRIFQSRHARDVIGLMIIDGMHEDLLWRIAQPSRGFVLWGWGILSPLGIQRILGAIFSGVDSADRVYRKYAYQNGKYIKAQLQESLVADTMTKGEVVTAKSITTDSNTPLVVVSSGIAVRRDGDWARKQKELTFLTKNLISWDVVNKAPHYVWKTLEGREIMEKRLGELVKAGSKIWSA